MTHNGPSNGGRGALAVVLNMRSRTALPRRAGTSATPPNPEGSPAVDLTVPARPGAHRDLAALAADTNRPHELIAQAWLAGYPNQRTRDAYALGIRQWFDWCEARNIDPIKPLRAHIELWQRHLEASGRKPRTVSLRITTLASFFTYCLDEDIVAKDPMRGVHRPKIERRSPTAWLTRPQLADLLDAAGQQGIHQKALLSLLVFNGLRIAEACSLDVESLQMRGYYPVLLFIRKGGKTGEAYLARPAEAAIRDAIGDRATGPLLQTQWGTRMNQKAAQRIIDQAIRDVRGTHGRITPHALRHSWTTAALDANVPMDQVQHDGGWADGRMVTYYGHGRSRPEKAATHVVAGFILGAA